MNTTRHLAKISLQIKPAMALILSGLLLLSSPADLALRSFAATPVAQSRSGKRVWSLEAQGAQPALQAPAPDAVAPVSVTPDEWQTAAAAGQRSAATQKAFAELTTQVRTAGVVRVIVGLRGNFQAETRLSDVQEIGMQRAAIAQAQDSLLDRLPGYNTESVRRYRFIPYLAVEVGAAGLEALRASEQVNSIREDEQYSLMLAESASLIGARAAWAKGYTGAGQTVAILDSGVDRDHPFLVGKVVSEACYSSNTLLTSSFCPGGVPESTASGSARPCDAANCEHGTHVAGIVAGKGSGFSGVAPDAKIIAIQVFSRVGDQVTAFNSDILKGLERVYELSDRFEIAAVNMSLGGGRFTAPCDGDLSPFREIIDDLRGEGIATVIASGNDGYTDALSGPACVSSAVSVGSTDDGSASGGVATASDKVSEFSNSTPFLTLLAPGRWINSSVPGGRFLSFKGTSMAAPHVAGAWAVLKSKAPNFAPDRILAALTSTGKSVTDHRNGVTKPRIQLDAALDALNSDQGSSAGELRADDGTTETGVRADGLMIVNRLTPTSYPSKLQTVRVFFTQYQGLPGPAGARIRLVAFNGAPGATPQVGPELLLDQQVTIPGIASPGFVDFNLQNGPIISAGEWFVGFQAPNPAEGVVFSTDKNGEQQRRSFFSTDGGATWKGPLGVGNPVVPANAMIRALVTAVSPPPAPGGDTVALNSGVPQGGSISAPEPGKGRLGQVQYTIRVPDGASQLKIDLSGNQDVDLVARFGQRVEVRNGEVMADHLATTENTSRESLTITPATSPALRAGTYYIGVGNFGPGAADFTVTATVQGGSTECSYRISPDSRNHAASGGTGTVSVTAGNGCHWTAERNGGFITITSGNSGTGSGSVSYSIEPNNGPDRRSGSIKAGGQTFTITQDGVGSGGNRAVSIVQTGGAPGSQVSLPIELMAQGDEAGVGFSLSFDPAVLGNPRVARGTATINDQLVVNDTQVGQGKIGVGLALGGGRTFAAGKNQIAVLTFTIASGATASSTTLSFGDQPLPREVVSATGSALNAAFNPGSVAITQGYEADVTPRPTGKNNGTIGLGDWVQVGRFYATLDTPAPGSEFQRADCAPRETKGDGRIGLGDWVQAGRYYARLDPVTAAGGQATPTSSGALAGFSSASALNVKVLSEGITRGQLGAVVVEMDSQGNENAFGFSLRFDPVQLTFVSAAAGSDATGATVNINQSQATAGRIGVAIALPAGQRFQAGSRRIIKLTFAASRNGAAATTSVTFDDQPLLREVYDPEVRSLAAQWNNGVVALRSAATAAIAVSAASYQGGSVASEAIVAIFGPQLATRVETASSLPLPTSLAGTTVKVSDSSGVERLAPLLFVAPQQVNCQMPPDLAPGTATMTITSGDGSVSVGTISITPVAPGLFTAASDGTGAPSAIALRVRADGTQSYEPVAQYDAAQNRFVALPIDLGPAGDQVFLILFGTGWRHRSALSAVSVSVGGENAEVLYAGAQGGFVGLDQINLRLPRALAGRGENELALSVDGREANRVKINVR
jgi:uncharacterized protein (TIGR03437 family)